MVDKSDLKYKFLKLVEAQKPIVTAEDMGLDKEDFLELVVEINDDKLVENIGIGKGAGKIRNVFTNKLTLTKSGKKYIEVIEEL